VESIGSGAFRLIGCRITSVHYKDGTSTDNPGRDPAVGALIGGANERVAAKLVDLDPQWQMASQIWGLEIRLSAGSDPPLAYGKFVTSAFRDLTFKRIHTEDRDFGASSTFQSVLEGLIWSADAANSRVLRELKDMTASNSLSMRLMTFAYVGQYGRHLARELNNPRGYLDGQIYLIKYALNREPANSHSQMELIVVHARDSCIVASPGRRRGGR